MLHSNLVHKASILKQVQEVAEPAIMVAAALELVKESPGIRIHASEAHFPTESESAQEEV